MATIVITNKTGAPLPTEFHSGLIAEKTPPQCGVPHHIRAIIDSIITEPDQTPFYRGNYETI